MSCFLRLSNFVVSRGGAIERGGFSGGASGRVMGAIWSVQTSNLSFCFKSHWTDPISFDGRQNFQFPIFFQLQLCLSKRNIRSDKNTALRADCAALVGIERLTFQFGGSGMTIGPKSSFSSCSV